MARHAYLLLMVVLCLAVLPATGGCSRSRKQSRVERSERVQSVESEPRMVPPGRERVE